LYVDEPASPDSFVALSMHDFLGHSFAHIEKTHKEAERIVELYFAGDFHIDSPDKSLIKKIDFCNVDELGESFSAFVESGFISCDFSLSDKKYSKNLIIGYMGHK